MDSEKVIHLIHFNDVYNLNEKDAEPVGGAARFITAVESVKVRIKFCNFIGFAKH
jgi:5'-nucleotidase